MGLASFPLDRKLSRIVLLTAVVASAALALWLARGSVFTTDELFFEIRADREWGVIDMLAGPHEEALQLFPTRVVPLGDGGSAFTFTMFQAPGQPDEQFEGQYDSLLREFENLELLFS